MVLDWRFDVGLKDRSDRRSRVVSHSPRIIDDSVKLSAEYRLGCLVRFLRVKRRDRVISRQHVKQRGGNADVS